MQNPTMLLQVIMAERAREIAAQERVHQAGAARRGRGARFGSIRRRIGGMLVRAGLRLLPREATTTVGSPRLAARGTATTRG